MNTRDERRRRALDRLVDDVAIKDFLENHPDPKLPPVAVVIASYKERENIGAVVDAMPTTLCGLDACSIIVIDGEEDGSAAIVRERGGYAVIAPVNRGQGAALRLGYEIARTFGAQFIVTADADGQTDPQDLGVVLQPVIDGEEDFVNGSRRLGTTQSSDAVRNTGVVVYASIISALTHTKVTDSANPIRAMRAELSETLTLAEPQYQASELLIGAIMHGVRYAERPVTMRTRAAGHSKKGGNLVYGYRYGRVVLRTWWREKRAGGTAR
jgi:glycosyltransferase involved in cell wall biosynthesis